MVCQLSLFQHIGIDVYAGKVSVLILAFFDLSCFLILYLDCFHMVMLIGVLMHYSHCHQPLAHDSQGTFSI